MVIVCWPGDFLSEKLGRNNGVERLLRFSQMARLLDQPHLLGNLY